MTSRPIYWNHGPEHLRMSPDRARYVDNLAAARLEGVVTPRAAAKRVDGAAYSETGELPTAIISQLIKVTADLERIAQAMERPAACKKRG